MPGDDLTMGMILGMFIADAFIYGLLTWYVDQVKPGPFGQAKKLYFPFQVGSLMLKDFGI